MSNDPSPPTQHTNVLPPLCGEMAFTDASRGSFDTPLSSRSGTDKWPCIPGYQISYQIGRGGMGCVFAACDLTLEREVAIKMLLPGSSAKRFVNEALITAKLPHPNIPPVYALGVLD